MMRITSLRRWARGMTVGIVLASAGSLFGATAHAQAVLEQPVTVDIPPQPLTSALIALSRQTGIEVLMSADTVRHLHTQGAQGEMSMQAALDALLYDTALSFHAAGDKTVSVQPEGSDGGPDAVPDQGAASDLEQIEFGESRNGESTTASVETIRREGGIDEIIVTARRREESIQEVPISITALSGEDLKAFGIRSLADMEGIVPGLNMGGGGNGVKRDSSPFIRGVGQRETKVTLDPAVATYIDGVYIGRAAGAMLDVVDIESVQVLRGPQGTLFGRNATGGAISVSLKKPQAGWGGQISTNVGNYGRHDVTAAVNAPIVNDVLLSRLMVSSTNSGGYFTNTVDNTVWGGDDRLTGILQLRFLPTDRLTVDLLGERTRIRETPRPQRCQFLRPTGFATLHMGFINGGGLGEDTSIDGYNRYEGLCRRSAALPPDQFASDQTDESGSLIPRGRYWVDTATGALTLNWDVGDFGPLSNLTAKSISAWRRAEQIADEDLDAVAGTYLIRIQPTFDETTQISQELQFSGQAFSDRLFLNTGFYYFQEETPGNDLILSAGISPTQTNIFGSGNFATVLAEAAKERLQTDNESVAWNFQADFDLTPQLQLTAGVRWTREVHWSRYSKTYADRNSIANGDIVESGDLSGLLLLFHTEHGVNPVFDWTYSNREYFFTAPDEAYSPLDYRLVPDLFIGDELEHRNDAWTPMVSLKYKAGAALLDALHLDQAMLYATYSEGFHSGGVTAGAIERDPYSTVVPTGDPNRTNRPANTGIPCPLLNTLNPNASSCTNYITANGVPGDGYGTADPITFRPELVANYEIGLKLTGLDRRVQANLALFHMDYTDMQTTAVGSRFGIPVPYIENVGKSVIRGLELEFVAMPTPDWRIFVTGAYTDADIEEWDSHIIPLNADSSVSPDAPEYDIDRSDERMPRVPEWQFFVSTDYSFHLSGGSTLTPSIGMRYTSSIYHGFDRGSWVFSHGGYYYNHDGDLPPTTLNPDSEKSDWWQNEFANGSDPLITPEDGAKWKTTSRPTAFLDARIAWLSARNRMELALWGKNLTNEDDFLVGGIPLADVTGAVGQVYANPRTFGLTMTYNFGLE